jgi:hypothetical protein
MILLQLVLASTVCADECVWETWSEGGIPIRVARWFDSLVWGE